MAHLILLRECKSYNHNKDSNYGTHEQIEMNISQRKYVLNDIRNGYNIPFGTELKFMNYRVKKEVLPKFANDLNAINLNPYPNKTNFLGLFFSKRKRSVGRTFYFIQYCFKWLNRFPLKYFNPLKPVSIDNKESPNLFTNGHWCYNYILGKLDDPTETIKDEILKEEYVQEDIL